MKHPEQVVTLDCHTVDSPPTPQMTVPPYCPLCLIVPPHQMVLRYSIHPRSGQSPYRARRHLCMTFLTYERHKVFFEEQWH